MCSSGTLMVAPKAYKPWVGPISCRCGTKVSSPKGENPDLSRRLKTKTLRAWLPKKDNKLAEVGTKSSPTSTNHTTFLHQYLLSPMTFSFYDIFGQPCHSLMVIGVVADNPLFVVVHCYCQCLSYMHMQSLSHRSSIGIL